MCTELHKERDDEIPIPLHDFVCLLLWFVEFLKLMEVVVEMMIRREVWMWLELEIQ